MTAFQVFFLQIVMAFIVFSIIAKRFVWPRLAVIPVQTGLLILALIHAMRGLGLVFIVPGVVSPLLPMGFGAETAYGDLLTAVLALLAVIALLNNAKISRTLVWIYSIVGTLDLLNAFYKGLTQMDHANFGLIGAGWYIPTLIVPMLFVTHFLTFKLLVSRQSNTL